MVRLGLEFLDNDFCTYYDFCDILWNRFFNWLYFHAFRVVRLNEKRFTKGVPFWGFTDINDNGHPLCSVRDEYVDRVVELLNGFHDENEQLRQLFDEADDIILSQCTSYYQRQWENIKKNIKGDVE